MVSMQRCLAKQVYLVSIWVLGCLAATRNGHGQEPSPPLLGATNDTPQPKFRVASTPWDSVQSEWQGRVVIGENETVIYSAFCQVHDELFNALLRRYPRTVFITLGNQEDGTDPLGDPADSVLDNIWIWYGFTYGFNAADIVIGTQGPPGSIS